MHDRPDRAPRRADARPFDRLARIQATLLFPALAVLAAPLAAQVPVALQLEETLSALSPGVNDGYGSALAASADWLAVGSPLDDERGLDSGSVHLYARGANGWVLEQVLVAPDGGLGDRFGTALALDGTRLAVSAPEEDERGEDAGAIYVFVRFGGSWIFEAKVFAPDAQAFDQIGAALALSGERMLVGAPLDGRQTVPFCGTAYVFARSFTSWDFEQKIVAADSSTGARFGTAVALEGERALVGALDKDGLGAAYVFERDSGGWVQRGKLSPSGGASASRVWSVALADVHALVGVVPVAAEGGAVHVFANGTAGWRQIQRLALGAAPDGLGRSLTAEGDSAIAGAPALSGGLALAIRRYSGVWIIEEGIHSPEVSGPSGFGLALALGNGRLVVGAPGADSAGPVDSGAAYSYEVSPVATELCAGDGTSFPCPCGNTGAPGNGCELPQGTGGVRLDLATFSAVPSAESTSFVGNGFPPFSAPTVILLRSPNVESFPVALGDGLRCLGSTGLVRLAATSATNGTVSLQAAHQAGPGEFHYQYWFRSSPASFCTPAGFNTSNALTVTFP